MSEPGKTGRVELLDAWRGTAVIVMVFWHLAWDLSSWGLFDQQRMFAQPAVGIRYYIICSFVLLAGISCRYSRSNARRGVQTLAFATGHPVENLLDDYRHRRRNQRNRSRPGNRGRIAQRAQRL